MVELNEMSIVVASDNQTSAQVDDETVLLHLEEGKYYGLNSVGARIWELIEQPIRVRKIVDMLCSEYDVERDRCRDDVLQLLASLEDKGMVSVREDA